jgi:NADH-quinone oxidoreductase subunit M
MQALLAALAYDRWALAALLWIPVLGAAAVLLAPAARAKHIALAATLLEFLVSLGLWWAYDPAGADAVQLAARHAWIPAWGIQYYVGIDGISLFMVLLTTFLMPLAVLGSWKGITQRERGYYALMLVLATGMIGVFVSLDLFLFYVFWEVMLVPMYFIIGVWGGKGRLYASIKFFVYTMVGSLLMLVAILMLYFAAGRATGTYSFQYEHILRAASLPLHAQYWCFGAFFLAFAIKVPMVPFHTWLPDAHVEAPTAGSVILAGVLLKMGTYGFLRFAIPFFPAVAFQGTVGTVVVVLAVVGMLYGALVAMVQPDFKKLIAYSSVSHLGFVVLGIWALTVQSVQGALMVMINHGISTGALFFLVGMIYERRHSRMLADFGGIARVVPAYAAILTVVSLSSIGLPGLNGFVGEFLVLLGSFRTHPLAAAVGTLTVIFAAAYLLWALKRMLYGKVTKPENEALGDLTRREYAVLVPLLVVIVWLGLFPGPVLRRMQPSSERFIELVRQRVPAAGAPVRAPDASADAGRGPSVP